MQLCSGGGQCALQRGVGAHLQRSAAPGHGGADGAIHGGVQRHGGLCVQRGAGAVLALGQLHRADVQAVLAAIKPVVAHQALGFHGG